MRVRVTDRAHVPMPARIGTTAQGFPDPRVMSSAPIAVTDASMAAALGEARFFSITHRLFKLPNGRLETLCEDYGQWVAYKGTVEGAGGAYQLDDHHRFEKAR
jgi:arsenite methyltransferase